MTLKEKINQAFKLLQNMEIKASKMNVDALSYTLIVLQEAYQAINSAEGETGKAGEENGTV